MKKQLWLWLCITWFGFAAGQTVYVTNTGQKYHRDNCQHLSHSKIEVALRDALARGYDACKVCRPEQTPSSAAPEKNAAIETAEEPKNNSATLKQCSATTQQGSRCKRMTRSASGKCYQHGG